MQCTVSWKGATFSHIWEGTRRRVQVRAAGCTHDMAHQRTTRDGLFHYNSLAHAPPHSKQQYSLLLAHAASEHPYERTGTQD